MSGPRFSILVPTRDRPETLVHTLATVLSQPGDDYEVVVADNCSGPRTRALVEGLAAPRLRYARCDEVLPMADNWERGLSLCSGEYVTVLGDDDGLVIGALPMARTAIDAAQPEILSWKPHVYWWPDTIVPWIRNLLILALGQGTIPCSSRAVLQEFYRGEVSFGLLPQIYSAFFHRGLIEDARLRYDAFFTPRDVAPDVASAILGLHISEGYLFSIQPLSVRGNSGKSNGTAQWMRSFGAKQRADYFRDERIGVGQMMHASLIPSPNLNVVIANTMLKCKEAYFPDDADLAVDLHALLRDMIADLNREPEAYEDNLADIRAFAAKLGVPLGPADLPPKRALERRKEWGPAAATEDGFLGQLVVNCDFAGAANIADAVRLVEAILPAGQFSMERRR